MKGTAQEAFGVCLPGPWALEKGYLGGGLPAGKGHLATPVTPLAGHVVGQPHPALVFLEACCQGQGLRARPLSPCPQPAGSERGLVWRV